MNVQWYPGHMTKAKRQMQEDIKLIDLIIELVDARVPLSSRNPDIDELGKNKSRLILLNKADLADERQNEAWKAYFQSKGFYVVKVDSRNGSGMKTIHNVIQEACKEKIERDQTPWDQKPSDPCNGSGNPECRKVHLYQYICRQSVCKDRKQTWCYKGETVDPPE